MTLDGQTPSANLRLGHGTDMTSRSFTCSPCHSLPRNSTWLSLAVLLQTRCQKSSLLEKQTAEKAPPTESHPPKRLVVEPHPPKPRSREACWQSHARAQRAHHGETLPGAYVQSNVAQHVCNLAFIAVTLLQRLNVDHAKHPFVRNGHRQYVSK